MKPTQPARHLIYFLLAAFLGLAACGGGGGGGVVGTTYYVDGSKTDDTGDGLSPATAHRFIHTAMANAVAPATILVNAGDYQVDYQLGTHVVLKEGVSLYGGYNANFSARNPAIYVTRIEDRSTTGGTQSEPNRAIDGDGSVLPISSGTVVDGFTIQGSLQYGEYHAAILLRNGAAPTLRNNIIHGGNATNSVQQGITYGIITYSASPTIQNNTIHGGSGSSFTYGIYSLSSSPKVYNNTIHGGSGDTSYGMYNNQSSPTVRNNTMFGGSGTSSHVVYLSAMDPASANPSIDNNILFSHGGIFTACIEGFSNSAAGARPLSVRNNNLYNCAVIYFNPGAGCTGNGDGDGDSRTCSVSELNALLNISGGASGNISVDSLFADIDGADNNINTMNDNNWHFSASSPAGVTAGGLNGRDQLPAWPFTTDKGGINRPASGNPWSIGAYEPI
jgi:hypothetical protein